MAEDKRRSPVRTEEYSTETRHEDREFGLYWYEWLWRLLRPVLIFLCSVLIVIGLVNYGYNWIYDNFLGPVDAENDDTQEFIIESGTAIASIGSNLEEAQLVRNGTVFRYLVQLEGVGNQLSYGSFRLSPSMTVNEVITELTSGSETSERSITIIPGWTCEDIADYLVEAGALESTDEFLKLCNDVDRFVGDSNALRFAQDHGTLVGRKYALEGYLAPDTYRIFMSASAEDIITRLLDQHNTVLDRTYYASEESQYQVDQNGAVSPVETYESRLNMDQTIVLASMIEKEAKLPEDYAKVSAVFHNRLNAGMKLESDPTATYLFGLSHYILSEQELTDPNLYNTYRVPALPVGPICNPSIAAIEAAMHPDMDFIREGYMYFCATDPATGELAYAITKEEHDIHVAQYQQMWEEYDAMIAQRVLTQS